MRNGNEKWKWEMEMRNGNEKLEWEMEMRMEMFNFAYWGYKLTEKDFFVSLTN